MHLSKDGSYDQPTKSIFGCHDASCSFRIVFADARARWSRVGEEWLECLFSIPIIAIVPFAISIWAVRKAAPTNLVRTGAIAGLLAGGVSAMAYSLHCTDDSLPFVAVWYAVRLCCAP